jgi:hypothetical protein
MEPTPRFSLFGGSSSSSLGFDDLFDKISDAFDIDFGNSDVMVGALLSPDAGFGALVASAFGKAFTEEMKRQTTLLLEWHERSVPQELWTQVDTLYARQTFLGFGVHVVAGGWFVKPLYEYLLPSATTTGLVNWYSNARLFQPYWGAFGPLVAGITTTITVSPITLNNMMLILPIWLTAAITSMTYALCQFIWYVIENLADYLTGVTEAIWGEASKAFEQLTDNVKEIF